MNILTSGSHMSDGPYPALTGLLLLPKEKKKDINRWRKRNISRSLQDTHLFQSLFFYQKWLVALWQTCCCEKGPPDIPRPPDWSKKRTLSSFSVSFQREQSITWRQARRTLLVWCPDCGMFSPCNSSTDFHLRIKLEHECSPRLLEFMDFDLSRMCFVVYLHFLNRNMHGLQTNMQKLGASVSFQSNYGPESELLFTLRVEKHHRPLFEGKRNWKWCGRWRCWDPMWRWMATKSPQKVQDLSTQSIDWGAKEDLDWVTTQHIYSIPLQTLHQSSVRKREKLGERQTYSYKNERGYWKSLATSSSTTIYQSINPLTFS